MDKPNYEQLDELYKAVWSEFSKAIEPHKVEVSIPFLSTTARWKNGVQTEDWWTKADLKVMIVGREVNGKNFCIDKGHGSWAMLEAKEPGFDYNVPLSIYDDFCVSKKISSDEQIAENAGPLFKNAWNPFVDAIKKTFANKDVAFFYDNLDALAKPIKRGQLDATLLKISREKFSKPTFSKKLSILGTDIVICLGCDVKVVEEIIESLSNKVALSEVITKYTQEGKRSVYVIKEHPSQSNGEIKTKYEGFVKTIIADIKENFK
jgi:hypothetical protein